MWIKRAQLERAKETDIRRLARFVGMADAEKTKAELIEELVIKINFPSLPLY
jgi:hypothetical protein